MKHFYPPTFLKKFTWLVLSILIFAGIWNSQLTGQTRSFYEHGHKIQHFTVKDGLPSSHVGGIGQDKNGYLWLATAAGFLRHDGYNFKQIAFPEELMTYTLKDHLNKLIVTDSGNIVLSTLGGGVIAFNPSDHSFKRFSTENFNLDNTYKLVEDTLGNIWYGSLEALHQIDKNDSLWSYKMKAIDKTFPPLLDSLKQEGHKIIENTTIELGQLKRVPFSLDKKTNLNVLCISRLDETYDLLDHGWIEDAAGKIIWEVDINSSLNAGGSFFLNRADYAYLSLAAGNYTLVYSKSDKKPINYYEKYGESIGFEAPKNPLLKGIQTIEDKDSSNKIFQQLVHAYKKSAGMLDGLTYNTYKDNKSNIWWHSQHHFGRIDKANGAVQIRNLCSPINQPCPCRITALLEKDDTHLWVGGVKRLDSETLATYVGIYNIETKKFEEIKLGIPSLSSNISSLQMDKNGNLWIGTEGQGLFKLSPPFYPMSSTEQAKLFSFEFELSNVYIGNANEIYAQYIDNNNNLWVGTRVSGIYKINLNSTNIEFNNLSTYIPDGSYLNMVEDSLGNIWIGSSTKGLLKIEAKTKEKILYSDTWKGVQIGSYIAPIALLPNGNILFGTKQSLIEYHPKKEEIIHTLPFTFRTPFPMIFGGELINDSLIIFPSTDIVNINTWEVFKAFEPPLKGTGVFHGVKSNQEGFWIAPGYGNVFKLKINDNELDTLYSFDNQVWVSDAIEDLEGNCWTTSTYGLQEFNITTGKRTTYIKEKEKFLDVMGSMQVDGAGNIWIFPISGIVKFDRKEKKLEKIYKFKEVDAGASLYSYSIKNKKGEIHVLGSKGLYSFHPDSLTTDKIAPSINITSLQYEEENGLLQTIKQFKEETLTFNYQQNNLSIEFVGVNFNDSKQTTYSYQLENHQQDWQEVGKERIARYPNLPPGDYTFKVKTANADGVWSQPKSLKLTIQPPWWKTWWAYLLYIFATVSSILWYIRTLNNRLAKEQAHNKELIDLNIANQRFVPKDFLQILGKQSIKDLHLGDQTQAQMTILFSDIRSYTTLSEKMTPQQNFNFINAYLGRIGPLIKKNGGFISQYMGDGFMALFVTETANAVQAAIDIQKELQVYNQQRIASNKVPLKTGIGLNTGELMLGVIGDEYRYESSVISDAVNTASRMEGLTKIFGGSIILSEKTLLGLRRDFPSPPKLKANEELGADEKLFKKEAAADEKLRGDGKSPRNRDFAYRYLGKVKVKGKDKALKIYDLYEGEPAAIRTLKAQTRSTFEQGIQHYFNRQFGQSAECFKQVLEVQESDVAAQYYLDKSVGYLVDGVTDNWSGVEEMMMK